MEPQGLLSRRNFRHDGSLLTCKLQVSKREIVPPRYPSISEEDV